MTILCKCQGGDFVLEEKIKKETVIASKSIVNSKTWQKNSEGNILLGNKME